MELIKNDLQSIEVRISIDELSTLHQSLNEICNGFYLRDFQSRIAATEKEASELMDDLSEIYYKIQEPSEG